MSRGPRVPLRGAIVAVMLGLLPGAAGCLRAVGLAGVAVAPPALDAGTIAAGQSSQFTVETIPVRAELARPYNHTSCVLALPNGELLVSWGAGQRELATDAAILLARRSIAGAWDGGAVLADHPNRADANSALFRDGAGELHLFYIEVPGDNFCLGTMMRRRSDDDGRTWSDARPFLPAVCTLLKNKPIVLRGGRWLLPTYTQAVYATQFWMSDDAGETWRVGEWLYTIPSNLQPAVVERSDGSLLALMRRGGEVAGFTWQGESHDGGVTWALTPRDDLLNPDSGLELLRLANGVLLVAYNDSATVRSPLVIRASLDEGATWLPARIVAEIDTSDGRSQVSYPSLAEGPDGLIHLTYSDNLESIAHAEFNLAWVLSMNQ